MSKKTKPKFQSTAAREKYDQGFSEAMKLKLKLNREGGLKALRRSCRVLWDQSNYCEKTYTRSKKTSELLVFERATVANITTQQHQHTDYMSAQDDTPHTILTLSPHGYPHLEETPDIIFHTGTESRVTSI